MEARSQAEAATTNSAATATNTTDEAHRAAEAARLEEAGRAAIIEEAARASVLAAETAKLDAAHALAKAREHEHIMAVQADIALKARHDEDLARAQATTEATVALAQRDQVLAAATEQNA